jgi:hypothetical protein
MSIFLRIKRVWIRIPPGALNMGVNRTVTSIYSHHGDTEGII